MSNAVFIPRVPLHKIEVVEHGRARRGWHAFDMKENFKFSTSALESYAFARWEPVIYDAMIVAAAIEYADRTFPRPALGWQRDFVLRVPVGQPARWMAPGVCESLCDAACFLTGDSWAFEFLERSILPPRPPQDFLPFQIKTDAVIAYSDGMDSRAVAGLVAQNLGEKLVRVRVGSKTGGTPQSGKPIPFAKVPYAVKTSGETSARSRGFKFALIGGIAAYLAKANQIILPESGQGIFGPALATAVHAYPDYRNHPLFTSRMERFLAALLKWPAKFTFPRLWSTKGETLKAYIELSGSDDWRETRSCWRNARHCSLNHRLMQCGVCAACMLRRMSIHSAGLEDDENTYISRDLRASSLRDSIHKNFRRIGPAFEEYAIAGAQHLDHMADLIRPANLPVLRRHAVLSASAIGLPIEEVEERLFCMVQRHAAEWDEFLRAMGERSFLRQWTRA